VIGLINDGDQRSEVNLVLKADETKELVVDFRR
jgi:hypothetical protein